MSSVTLAIHALAAFGLGYGELALIVFVVLLLFGAKKLPQLGKSVGEGLKNFKRGLRDAEKDDDEEPATHTSPRVLPDDSKRANNTDTGAPAKKHEAT